MTYREIDMMLRHVDSGDMSTPEYHRPRKIDRFPPDFAFQLTRQEFRNLKSQTVILKAGGGQQLTTTLREQQVEAACLRHHFGRQAKLDAATCLRQAKRLPVRRQTGGRQVAANLKELGYAA